MLISQYNPCMLLWWETPTLTRVQSSVRFITGSGTEKQLNNSVLVNLTITILTVLLYVELTFGNKAMSMSMFFYSKTQTELSICRVISFPQCTSAKIFPKANADVVFKEDNKWHLLFSHIWPLGCFYDPTKELVRWWNCIWKPPSPKQL